MTIAVIQASSQSGKNALLFDAVTSAAKGHTVINFGRTETDRKCSYIQVSAAVGLLLASQSVDFVVTGCSSGQGMMLACNNMSTVLCGYIPTPKDAYLFAQINNGNAVSLPLGEEYTYAGERNLKDTLNKLFSEPFGQGYPKSDAQRKMQDTLLLKKIKKQSQTSFTELFDNLDESVTSAVFDMPDVIDYVLKNGREKQITEWLKQRLKNR